METWLKALSPSTRQTDAVAQNLEFNLQVYFAIFPIHDYVDVTQAKVNIYIYICIKEINNVKKEKNLCETEKKKKKKKKKKKNKKKKKKK